MNQFDEHHYHFPRSTKEAFGDLEPMRDNFHFHEQGFSVWLAVGIVLILIGIGVLIG